APREGAGLLSPPHRPGETAPRHGARRERARAPRAAGRERILPPERRDAPPSTAPLAAPPGERVPAPPPARRAAGLPRERSPPRAGAGRSERRDETPPPPAGRPPPRAPLRGAPARREEVEPRTRPGKPRCRTTRRALPAALRRTRAAPPP